MEIKIMLSEVYDKIPAGADNRISSRDLRIATGLNARDLKRAVKALRENGAVICSCYDSEGGYYRPSSPEEAFQYVQIERQRIQNEQRSLQSAEAYVRDYEESRAEK